MKGRYAWFGSAEEQARKDDRYKWCDLLLLVLLLVLVAVYGRAQPATLHRDFPDKTILRRGNDVLAATLDGDICYGTHIPLEVTCKPAVLLPEHVHKMVALPGSCYILMLCYSHSMTFSELAKTWFIICWFLLMVAVGTLASQRIKYFTKRRSLRTLDHAKFYLYATTSARKRDHEALHLLTQKIFEVQNS